MSKRGLNLEFNDPKSYNIGHLGHSTKLNHIEYRLPLILPNMSNHYIKAQLVVQLNIFKCESLSHDDRIFMIMPFDEHSTEHQDLGFGH